MSHHKDCDKKCKDRCVVTVRGPRGKRGHTGATGPALSSSNLYASATGPQSATTILIFKPVVLNVALATSDWSLVGSTFRTTVAGRYAINYSLTFLLVGSGGTGGDAFIRMVKNGTVINGSIRQTFMDVSIESGRDVETITGTLNVDLVANDTISLEFAVANLNILVSGFGFNGPPAILPDPAQLTVVRIS